MNDKLIIFDWGGVVESHFDGEYNCFTQKIDIIKSLSEETYDNETILQKWSECNDNEFGKSIGEINNDVEILDWFMRIKKQFHLNCTFEEFENAYYKYGDKIEFYEDVVHFSHYLKDKCNIGILSNLCKLDYPRIDKHYHLSEFDYVWLSYDKNCKKPKEEIYKIVEKESGILPQNILFIDDVLENIMPAKQRGWQTCQATGRELDKIKKSVGAFLGKELD